MIYQRLVIRSCARYAAVIAPTVTLISGLVFFSRLLGNAAAGQTPPFIIGHLFLLTLLKYAPQLMILAAFAGVFIAMRRAFAQNEMTAWFSSGLGLHHFIKPVLLFALPLAGFVALFSLFVSPWSVREMNTVRATAVFDFNLKTLPREQFSSAPNRRYSYFLNEQDTLFIANNARDEVIFAKGVQRDDDTALRLLNGNLFYLSTTDGASEPDILEKMAFETLRLVPAAVEAPHVRPRAKALSALTWESSYDRAELGWRLALPLAVLTLALFALYLSPTSSRSGRRSGFLSAIAVFALYLNGLRFLRDLVADDTLPIAAALLLPPLLLGLGVGLFTRLLRRP